MSEDELTNGEPTHGTIVCPGVNAQIHQHMFCARLDVAGKYTKLIDLFMFQLSLNISNAFGFIS